MEPDRIESYMTTTNLKKLLAGIWMASILAEPYRPGVSGETFVGLLIFVVLFLFLNIFFKFTDKMHDIEIYNDIRKYEEEQVSSSGASPRDNQEIELFQTTDHSTVHVSLNYYIFCNCCPSHYAPGSVASTSQAMFDKDGLEQCPFEMENITA